MHWRRPLTPPRGRCYDAAASGSEATLTGLKCGVGETVVTPEPPNDWRRIGLAASLGLVLVAATAIGAGGGWLLDRWLGTAPWCLTGGLLVGVAAGFLEIFRLVMRNFVD